MKKLFSFIAIILISILSISCSSKPKLYIVNWGDYMDPALISAFEAEYGVDVEEEPVDSNEAMATRIQTGSYDIAVFSEYMVDKLIDQNLLQPINFALLTNNSELTVIPKLSSLYCSSSIVPYVIPYAWGTIGIMYDNDKPELKALIETEGWAALFEHTDEYNVGMYDSSRDAVAAALLYKGYNVNSDNLGELAEAEAALIAADFSWGTDELRGWVIEETLDMALVYSGDYFSEYYLADEDSITFDFYVPTTTNVWLDSMVIPQNAQNVVLAHQFIDFFLREDIAIANSDYIGYAPCYEEIYNALVIDYGYDMVNFDPYPDDTIRQMYVYGTDERSQRLTAILLAAKNNN
ncbi:MAG: extracellular solute-binding protein [Candidatus Izemoplasmatales bacterium]